jgi:hypothetical protein
LGRVWGKKNAESGHLARIATAEVRAKGGRTSGQNHVASGHIQELGRTQGKKNVESGRLAGIITQEIRARGGRASGRLKVESGEIYRMPTPESCAKGGLFGNHIRWHSKRNIVNPACKLCSLSAGAH